MVSVPTGRAVVVTVAMPAGFTVPVPRVTPPLVMVTEPVVPEVRVVVMVTGVPKTLGPEVVTEIVGVILEMTWTRVAVDVLLLLSPL